MVYTKGGIHHFWGGIYHEATFQIMMRLARLNLKALSAGGLFAEPLRVHGSMCAHPGPGPAEAPSHESEDSDLRVSQLELEA
jgi:hypothetical protein